MHNGILFCVLDAACYSEIHVLPPGKCHLEMWDYRFSPSMEIANKPLGKGDNLSHDSGIPKVNCYLSSGLHFNQHSLGPRPITNPSTDCFQYCRSDIHAAWWGLGTRLQSALLIPRLWLGMSLHVTIPQCKYYSYSTNILYHGYNWKV